jgi:SCP-2 sterol transfer family
MTSPTEAFFTSLGERGHEPLLRRASGTVRVDLSHGRGHPTEHWFLDLQKGRVAVSHRDEAAGCVIRSDRDTFDRIASGRSNALASMLRNEMSFEGDPALVVLLQKLFPWPDHTTNPEGRTR